MNSARPIIATEHWRTLVVLDADCPLCRRSAHFLLRHESGPRFLLAGLSSSVGERLGRHFGADPRRLDSVWCIRDGELFRDSEALWRLAQGLRWPWTLGAELRQLPRPLRDIAYRAVGNHRHRLAPDIALNSAARGRFITTLTEEHCRQLGLPSYLAMDDGTALSAPATSGLPWSPT
ncbi:thiol-disulfide oxidoreductase DCC family protein [Halomonas sp. WWR20]